MTNPWALTPGERKKWGRILGSAAMEIMRSGAAPRHPIDYHLRELLLYSHAEGQVEYGMIIYLISFISEHGQEQGRDQMLAALTAMAAQYGDTPSGAPSFSEN